MFEVIADKGFESAKAGDGLGHGFGGVGIAKVEAGKPGSAIFVAGGDVVELIFHGRGEVIIHQGGEVLFKEPDDGEGHPGRNKSVATRIDIAAVLDGADDGGIGGRTADAELFHLFHQAGFGVASRRVCGMPLGGHAGGGQAITASESGKALLGVIGEIVAIGLPSGFHIGLEETRKGDGAPSGGEFAALARRGVAKHGYLHGGATRVGHLGSYGALPNQLVQLKFLGVELRVQLAGGGKSLTGGTDGLVRLLRILHLARVLARGGGKVIGAVKLACLSAGGLNAGFGKRGGVGTHIGDVTVLIEALGDAHGALGGVMQFAPGLLLQRRGHKGGVRLARVGLFLHGGHLHGGAREAIRERTRGGFVEDDRLGGKLAAIIKIAAYGNTRAIDAGESGLKGAGVIVIGDAAIERCGEVPICGGNERHALPLALHDHAGGHGLHAAGGQARHDLLPQHRRNFITIEAVEDAAGFLRVHQIFV